MTSGEWDLRALKALEEEEQKQIRGISEPELLNIPPPPLAHQKLLPTIDEYCGDRGESPSPKCSSFLLTPSASLKYPKTIGQLVRANSQRQRKGSPTAATTTGICPSTFVDSNEMMTMMMFLSSTAPPELLSPSPSPAAAAPGENKSAPFTAKTVKNGGAGGGGGGGGVVADDCNGIMCNNRNSMKKPPAGCPATNSIHRNNKNATMCSAGTGTTADVIDDELEDHIKHCSCSCNHMGYGNSMDYQTTGFGGLPDVTEHSNIRRTISRQNSTSTSDLGDISSLQKTKKSKKSNRNSSTSTNSSSASIQEHKGPRKLCVFSLSVLTTLVLCTVASLIGYQMVFMVPSRNSHEERLKIARRILKEVPLVDGHNNFVWNVRKYAHSSLEFLEMNNDMDQKAVWNRPVWSQTDIPRLKEGMVGAQIWSAYVPCDAQGLDAVQLALEQIDIIHRFIELHAKDTALVTTSQGILIAHRNNLIASMIGIEGGHALGSSLAVLRSLHSLGARYLTLTHRCDVSWAGSSATANEKGLTPFGKAVIKEMNRLGMMVDLSHSSDATTKEVLDVTRAPVIFSQSAARHLCNSSRNIPDDVLRSVADNGGLIMISFDSEYVSCGEPARLQDVVAHIKYIRSISGIQHIGIGAGYDGIEYPPSDLEDVSKYPDLFATLLEDPGWSEDDIAMLAGKNFLRVLKSVENVRDYLRSAAIQPVETTEPAKKTQCTYMSS